MQEKVAAILGEIRPDVDFAKEKALIDDNVLESFDIIELVARLNNTFDIDIMPKELTADNFNSLDAITRLVQRLMEEED